MKHKHDDGTCLLCGRRKIGWLCVFVPLASRSPTGRPTPMPYALCKRCYRRPGTRKQVEQVLLTSGN